MKKGGHCAAPDVNQAPGGTERGPYNKADSIFREAHEEKKAHPL